MKQNDEAKGSRWHGLLQRLRTSAMTGPDGARAIQPPVDTETHEVEVGHLLTTRTEPVVEHPLSLLSSPQLDSSTRFPISREEREQKTSTLVSEAIRSAKTYRCRGLSLAVVKEFPPSNRYARAIFHCLAKNVNNGPEDLLTHLIQNIFIEPHTEFEERQCRYTQFAGLVSEESKCFEVVGDNLGSLREELELLQVSLRETIPNAFAAVTDDFSQEIPVFDVAIAVCEESVDAFVAYYRLRLTAFVDPTRKLQIGRTEEVQGESETYLAAVWERRTFSLRTNFLAEVEKEFTKLNGETNHIREGEVL